MAARAPIALTPYLFVVRLILFVVFVPAGIQSLSMVEFTGTEAEGIRRLAEPPQTTPSLIETEATPTSLVRVGREDTFTARALYHGALQLENAGWSSPVLLAWIGSLIQLVGGALLLPGLFCRVWGFGLCIVMAASFILNSWPVLAASPWPTFQIESAQFNLIASQLALFGLALGMLICSGGNFGLDRLIFGGHRRAEVAYEAETAEEE
jgi:uncharacterized membrane protein YphA (DoxX/SURF4 family)